VFVIVAGVMVMAFVAMAVPFFPPMFVVGPTEEAGHRELHYDEGWNEQDKATLHGVLLK
jgi:hypothetical protein